jgi:16S rRNA (uracil1498-N3)-methyltransferase
VVRAGWNTLVIRRYLAPDRFEGATAVLTGDAGHRLARVMRVQRGDELQVFDGRGRERAARVAAVAGGEVTLSLLDAVDPPPEAPVEIVLCCAFPRAQRGDWIIEKATELGVAAFVPLEAMRAVLRPGDGRLDRWQRIAISAAEQCRRAVVPSIEGDLEGIDAMLVCDLTDDPLPSIPRALEALAAPPQRLGIAIGPEGGWSDDERAAWRERGATLVTLGRQSLRVETAAIVAVAYALEATAER